MISDSQFENAAKRIMSRCDQLALISEDEGQTTRTFCCNSMKKVHQSIATWLTDAGCSSHIDAVGNLVGTNGLGGRSQSDDSKPILMIGSHLDTVINAGKYDGVLGVMLGLAVAELVNETNAELPFTISVVGFSEEEGVRFNRPYIGSSGIAGCFDETVLDLVDKNEVSVKQSLEEFGSAPADWAFASFADRNVIGFIEAHIEQGPVLQSESQPVGIVSAIAGQTRATFRLKGIAGHAGTTPHHLRSDALVAAAESIVVIEKCGCGTDGLTATVGSIEVSPNASNVIPGEAVFTLDLRHEDDEVRKASFDQIAKSVVEVCKARSVESLVEINLSQPAVRMDASINEAFSSAIKDVGHQPQTMLSGAGHDAAIMAKLAPTAMLFIRCRDGISHHPDEHVDCEDVLVALKVMMNTITSHM